MIPGLIWKRPCINIYVFNLTFQAAEKAIKSIQIVEDANEVGNNHFLTNSVSNRNPIIQNAALELEMIAVRYSRMRYPYVTLYPKTPSELYTQQDAEEAVRLATLIVDTVNDQYFS
jgi:HEPN domain-containing protein